MTASRNLYLPRYDHCYDSTESSLTRSQCRRRWSASTSVIEVTSAPRSHVCDWRYTSLLLNASLSF
jgi:hypothetical protein